MNVKFCPLGNFRHCMNMECQLWNPADKTCSITSFGRYLAGIAEGLHKLDPDGLVIEETYENEKVMTDDLD